MVRPVNAVGVEKKGIARFEFDTCLDKFGAFE